MSKDEKLSACLSFIKRNRHKDDLHSAMCYFKSSRVVYICCHFNGSFSVIYRDKDKQVDCSSIKEVLDLFEEENEELDYYDI